MGNNKFTIAISGASGFIGSHLSTYFAKKGYKVIPITRQLLSESNHEDLRALVLETDAIINLAGASINHRWTEAYKREMYDSRINTTRKIVEAINTADKKPKVFISVSAVGYYPTTGCQNEYSAINGEGFLAQLCRQWEDEAHKVSSDVRLVTPRFGVVLAKDGGAFEKMVLPTKFKVSTISGSGNQYFPWISLNDLTKAIEFAINNPKIKDSVNFVTPNPITNRYFANEIAKHYRCWLSVKIPIIFFKMLLGEASEIVTTGQCVFPKKQLDEGFEFTSATVAEFLKKE